MSFLKEEDNAVIILPDLVLKIEKIEAFFNFTVTDFWFVVLW